MDEAWAVKLRYTLRAAAELDKILGYIERHSPQGGRRAQARIQAVINLLSRHPRAGEITTKGRLRRVVVSPYPYLIFYRAAEDEIVIHGARRPSSMPE